MHTDLFQSMKQCIIDGEPEDAISLAEHAVEVGIDPLEAINLGFVPGLEYIGEQFSCGNSFLPELVMAGETMKAALSVLEPELTRRGAERKVLGTVVIATMQGDIHDIGKTLVSTMLASSGFRVYDLGVDVPITNLVATAKEVKADIVALSALLTTTMVNQRVAIQQITEAGLRPGLKVMVGGAPVTRSWSQEIGADGYSEDAIGAVAVARQLVGST